MGQVIDVLCKDRDQLESKLEITLDQILNQFIGGLIDDGALFNKTVDEGVAVLHAIFVRVEALVADLEILGEVDGDGEDGREVLLLKKLSNLIGISDCLDEVNGAIVVGDGDSSIHDLEGHGEEIAGAEHRDEKVQELHL